MMCVLHSLLCKLSFYLVFLFASSKYSSGLHKGDGISFGASLNVSIQTGTQATTNGSRKFNNLILWLNFQIARSPTGPYVFVDKPEIERGTRPTLRMEMNLFKCVACLVTERESRRFTVSLFQWRPHATECLLCKWLATELGG